MIELGISIAAAAAMFFWGLKGAKDGLFRSFVRFCFGIVALILAMRFWFPATGWLMEQLSVNAEQVSFAAFWGLFALVILPVFGLLKTINQDFIPTYPIVIERFAGFVFTAASIGIVASAVLLSFLPNLPSVLPQFDENKLLLPIHRLPGLIYHEAETRLTHVSADSPAHTLLPVGERTTPDANLAVHWK